MPSQQIAKAGMRNLSLLLSSSSSIKWAVGGWTFFILENLVLSENRSLIIQNVGDDNYHYVYGTISTCAMASVGYGYYKVKNMVPFRAIHLPMRIASFFSYAVGLGLLSQTAPKLQIPVIREDSSSAVQESLPARAVESSKAWKVRCPFDFTDNNLSSDGPRGVERISRHPGLWAFGLTCLGQAAITPSIPQASWFAMPFFVALAGGAHADARYRRGMGGTLSVEDDARTSNVPFIGLLLGGDADSLKGVVNECKGINASLAVGIAAGLAFRRPWRC